MRKFLLLIFLLTPFLGVAQTSIDSLVFKYINQYRVFNNIDSIGFSEKGYILAKKHADYMLTYDTLHTDNLDPLEVLLEEHGIDEEGMLIIGMSEITHPIYQYTRTEDEIALSIVDVWVDYVLTEVCITLDEELLNGYSGAVASTKSGDRYYFVFVIHGTLP